MWATRSCCGPVSRQGRTHGDELVGGDPLSAAGRRRHHVLCLIAPEYKLHGLTDKWLLRQVAAGTLPARIASRRKTMFRASRSDGFLGQGRPPWVDQLLCTESLKATGWFDPAGVARERAPNSIPANHAPADHHGPQPDLRRRHPALAPHLPGGRVVRAAHVGRDAFAPGRTVECRAGGFTALARRRPPGV